jgi:hypothetical protein
MFVLCNARYKKEAIRNAADYPPPIPLSLPKIYVKKRVCFYFFFFLIYQQTTEGRTIYKIVRFVEWYNESTY